MLLKSPFVYVPDVFAQANRHTVQWWVAMHDLFDTLHDYLRDTHLQTSQSDDVREINTENQFISLFALEVLGMQTSTTPCLSGLC